MRCTEKRSFIIIARPLRDPGLVRSRAPLARRYPHLPSTGCSPSLVPILVAPRRPISSDRSSAVVWQFVSRPSTRVLDKSPALELLQERLKSFLRDESTPTASLTLAASPNNLIRGSPRVPCARSASLDASASPDRDASSSHNRAAGRCPCPRRRPCASACRLARRAARLAAPQTWVIKPA